MEIAETAWGMIAITAVSFATVLIALGVDFGFTFQTLLNITGQEEALGLRVILFGTGILIYLLVYLFVPDGGNWDKTE